MALRAGSVGLGREAGLGARRGWTRRRRPLPRPGAEPPARGPSRPLRRPSPALPRRRRRRRGGAAAAAVGGGNPRASPGVPGRPGGCRRRRRLWTRAGPFPWIAPAAAGVAAAPGEGGGAPGGGGAGAGVRARPPRRSPPGPPSPPVLPGAAVSRAAPRLGRRLAADLELVRTRGIRLFN